MKRLLIVLLAAAWFPAQAADAPKPAKNAAEVLACVRANVPPALRIQDLELTTTDQGGTAHTLKGRLFVITEKGAAGPGEARAMLRVEDPPQLAGAAYLVRETDDYLRDGMFVYLPSVKRVRRVTGTFADGSLLGTTFSYYDFKQIQNAFGDLDATLEAPVTIADRAAQVLVFKPRAGTETRYSRVRAWIDQTSCLPLKVDFYEGETLRKQLTTTPGALRQSGGYWHVSESEIVDLKDKSRTRLRILKVNNTKELAGRYFDPNTFYLGN